MCLVHHIMVISCCLSREIHHDVICNIDLPVTWVMMSYKIWGDITCFRRISRMTSWPKKRVNQYHTWYYTWCHVWYHLWHMISHLKYDITYDITCNFMYTWDNMNIICDITFDIIYYVMISYISVMSYMISDMISYVILRYLTNCALNMDTLLTSRT